jgi:tetratricopeptide (TPR) repeat protein
MRIARLLVEAVELREIGIARSCESPTAFGHFLLGRHQLRHLDLPGIRHARKALRAAVEMAPGFAQAHGWLARSHLIEWVLRARWETENLAQARRSAELAIERDPMDGIGYRELGRAALFQGDLDEGVHHLEVAVDRSPQHADILADCADTLVHASEIDSAERHIRAAFSLNPLPPEQYHWTAGAIFFFKGQFDEALAALERMDNTEPASRLMAATAAMLGDQKLAAKYKAKTLAVHPDFRVSEWMKVMPQRDPAHREMYETALRRAGFE